MPGALADLGCDTQALLGVEDGSEQQSGSKGSLLKPRVCDWTRPRDAAGDKKPSTLAQAPGRPRNHERYSGSRRPDESVRPDEQRRTSDGPHGYYAQRGGTDGHGGLVLGSKRHMCWGETSV